jgi:hypothetical protein
MNAKSLHLLACSMALFALTACDVNPSVGPVDISLRPLAPTAFASVQEDGWEGGAIVLNDGEGPQPAPRCFFGGLVSFDGTLVRQPSGNWILNCRFSDLPPIAEQQVSTGWICSIIGDPLAQTHHSSFIRQPNGTAHMDCQFSDKPVQDAVVSFADLVRAAQQAAFGLSLADVPGQEVTGETVGVGLGCAPLGDLTGRVVVAERGVCSFTQKAQNALSAGAAAIVVYNSAAFGDQIIVMSGIGQVAIPAVFVGRSTGLAILAASPTQLTITHCARSASCRGEL